MISERMFIAVVWILVVFQSILAFFDSRWLVFSDLVLLYKGPVIVFGVVLLVGLVFLGGWYFQSLERLRSFGMSMAGATLIFSGGAAALLRETDVNVAMSNIFLGIIFLSSGAGGAEKKRVHYFLRN